MNIQEAFGLCVKHEREKLGLSQEAFAFNVGLDRTYISSVERGMRNISIKNIEKISVALNIKMDELLKRTLIFYKNS